MKAQQQQQRAKLLMDHYELWSMPPYKTQELPWTKNFPELIQWLFERTDLEIQVLERQRVPALPVQFTPWLADYDALLTMPRLSTSTIEDRAPRGVKPHKSAQITALGALAEQGEWVDWCCGKGHLGRSLARRGLTVVGLERDPCLCELGATMSVGLDHRFEVHNVLQSDALQPQHQVIALHACGALTDRLLQRAVNLKLRRVVTAMCCPHRRFGLGSWMAWSEHTRPFTNIPQHFLQAATRDGHRNHKRLVNRCSLDMIYRDVFGDRHHNQPRISRAILDSSLATVVDHLRHKGEALPTSLDLISYSKRGQKRMAWVSRMDLVRATFRRLLEVTVYADRALWLQDQGYEVSLGTFCSRQASPRNLVIVGQRADHPFNPIANDHQKALP